MHTVIFGAGAVGGYFGGKLARAGFPVTFLVRKRRFEQLKNRGLIISSFHGDFTINPHLVVESKEIENPELVILALKNYHLEEALPQLEVLISNGATILPLLNGVQHMDTLTDRFGEENILGGVCYIESTLNEEGNIVQTSPMHDIVFGSLREGQSEFTSKIVNMLKKSELNVLQTDNIISEMWKKFILLTTLSGITSATRQPIGVARNDLVTRALLVDFIHEIYQIAITHKVPLPEDTVERIIKKVEDLPPAMTSSMHRDLEKGLPIEVESLQGYVLELANKHEIQIPVSRAIYSLLHPFLNGTPQLQ
ncbi:ketopantoate reductase family protein [Paenibacillus sp. RC67]|uniref:ketopantoate reductase family protein n=1 Tax=Paenibacillus sp. RC67 TaxID=3039392 RepID=UPI0024ACB10B|nr:ketopantoate reductase family protein [Paenibacillus sp. RC67]